MLHELTKEIGSLGAQTNYTLEVMASGSDEVKAFGHAMGVSVDMLKRRLE